MVGALARGYLSRPKASRRPKRFCVGLSGGTSRLMCFQGLDGECMVALYRNDECARVIISPSGLLGLRIERGLGFQYTDVIPPSDDVGRMEVYRRVVRWVRARQ